MRTMRSPHAFQFKQSTVQYWEYGDSTLPTIIMIHGFRGTHHGLARIIEQLPQYHIIVPDLPGFGASDPFIDQSHTIASYQEFLQAFITNLKLSSPPILLGHSFGSIIASHFAANNADVIDKLILINPIGAPALDGPKAVLSKLAIFYYFVGRKLPKKLSHSWLSTTAIVKIMSISMTKSKEPAMRRYIHDQHLTYFSRFANPRVVAEAFTASVSHDVREVAGKITVPTLLIAGEQDDITPLEKQHALSKLIKNSQLAVINDVGHLIHYETAAEAAKLIREFIDA